MTAMPKEMTAVAAEHEWMLPCEVAEKLRMKERTLENWRLAEKGPAYYRRGAGSKAQVLYRREDVYVWMEQHRNPNTGGAA